MSATSIGSLIVQMNADSKALARSMREGLSVVESTVREMKKLGREVAQVGLGITAFFAGMVRAAAGVDNGVKRSVDALHAAFLTLATQIAGMVMPAVRQLTELLRDLANWFAGLPAGTRQTISDFALFALKAGAVALVLSKLAGVAQGLIAVFSGVAAVVAAIGAGPLALLIAGLVAVAVAVAVIHKAWRTNWGGIRDVTREVIETVSKWWGKFAGFLGDIWSGIVDDIASKALAVIQIVLKVLALTGKMDEKTAAAVGMAASVGITAAADVAKSPSAMKTLALEATKGIAAAGLDVVREFKIIGREIRAALGLESNGGVAETPGGVGHGGHGKHAIRSRPEGHEATSEHKTSHAPVNEVMVWATLLDDALESLTAGVQIAGAMFVSRLGDLGQIINSAVQGFEQGGVFGALAAVIAELLSRFQRFQEIIDIGNGFVQRALEDLGPALGELVDGLRPLLGALGMIAHVVHGVLAPIITLIGRLLGGLAPVFALISIVLEPFAQSLATLFDVLIPMLEPAFEILNKIMTGVALLFLGVMTPLLYLKAGFLELAKWLDHTFNVTGNHAGIDKAVVDAWAEVRANEQKMQDVAANGLGGLASQSANAAEAIGKMGQTADQVSEQLLNVPAGFKTALYQFNATLATSSTGGGGGGSYDNWQKTNERVKFRNTGNPSGGGTNPSRPRANKDA